MRKLSFLAVLLCAAPSFAARWASRPADDSEPRSSMQGLYAAVGAGGALVILDAGNAFGYDVEGRLGYSFNPGLQLYLSGSIDGANVGIAPGATLGFRSELIAAFLQYHLYASQSVGVFARAGIGVAMSSSFGDSAVGLAEAGGIGVEIGLSHDLFLTPELFYKTANLSVSNGGGSTTEQVVGLQLSLMFY